MPCPFCSLSAERIVDQNELAVAIRDAYPVSPGHTLIIPRRHVASLPETTAEERAALMDLLLAVQGGLDGAQAPDGYNIGVNQGEAAGQTVPHLHIHLIPRRRGDTRNPRGGVRHCIPGRGDYQA